MPLTAYVLLTERPTDLATFWGSGTPQSRFAQGATDGSVVAENGIPVSVSLGAKVQDAQLATDADIAPISDPVLPAVHGHVAAVALTAEGQASAPQQQRALCEVIAELQDHGAEVVWFPHRRQVTSIDRLLDDLSVIPTRTYYWIHASRAEGDPTSGIVAVRGLASVGMADLQVTGSAEDLVHLLDDVEGFVSAGLDAGRLPVAGDTAEIAGTVYTCTAGHDELTGDASLLLCPIEDSDVEAQRTTRQHWLAPHSEQIAAFEGPYDQLVTAFEDLQTQGIVARMDFACCQNCGHTEIGDERTIFDPSQAEGDYPYRESGYVFFHKQDSDRVAEAGDDLYLAFGAFPGSALMPDWPDEKPQDDDRLEALRDVAAKAETQVAQTVVQALRAAGLGVEWGGSFRERITVQADWLNAEFPWNRVPLDYEDVLEAAHEHGELPTVNPAVIDNAWFVLLNAEPATLGDLLYDIMPNFSAQLREEEALHGEVPYGDPDVTLTYTVVQPLLAPGLADDAQLSGIPGAVEAAQGHVAALCISADGSAPAYEQVMYQASMAAEVGKLPQAIALWVPSQHRVELEVDQVGEMAGKYPYLVTHRAEAQIEDGAGHALYTRGLQRLGLKELVVEDPEGLATTDMRNMLMVVADKIVQSGKPPEVGVEMRTHSRGVNAILHEVEDPVSGDPALNVEFVERKKFLGMF